MCGGSSSPPPPPDYTPQINALRQSLEAGNQQKADEYNAVANAFNQSLGQARTGLSDLSSRIGGLNVASFYDDPATAENENPYQSLQSSLSSLSSNLGSLNMSLDRPSFQTFASGGPYSASVSTVPSLVLADTVGRQSLVGDVTGLQNQLNTLKQQRDAEEQRINAFRNQQLGNLQQAETGLGQLTIADLSAMNQLERDLSSSRAASSNFTSSIMDQLYPGGFNEIGSLQDSISSGLSDLRSQRAAEQQRVSDFGQSLYDFADANRDQIGNLTIADEAAMGSLQEAIDAKQREAERFSSLLPFNFTSQMGGISELERSLGNLSNERQRELDRIANAEQGFLSTARGVEQAAESGNIYSMAALNALDDRIRDLRTDVSGFSSLLPFDFGSVEDPLTQAEAAYAGLNERRAAELDALQARAQAANSGLGSVADYDEQALRDIIASNTAIGSDLSAFTGGRVGGISDTLSSNVAAVNERLAALTEQRNALEVQAQELDKRLREQTFYATDDTTAPFDEVQQLRDQIELYNAQQALDEITSATDRLNSEKARLERDAQAVAARDTAARNALLSSFGPTGVPEFGDLSLVDPLTAAQYLALLRSADDEEEQLPTSVSPFSQNLGVIRIG